MAAGTTDLDEGYTLVEMLVALVVLGLVMSGLASACIASLTSTRSATGQVAANQFATEVIESLRAQAFDALAPPGTATVSSPTYPPRTVKGITYTAAVNVSWRDDPCNGSATAAATYDYLRLNVVASWTVNQKAKSLTVDSFRTPGTLYRSPLSTPTAPLQTVVRTDSSTC